jgi:hypothetical protein
MCVKTPFSGGGSPTLNGFESGYVDQGKKVTGILKNIFGSRFREDSLLLIGISALQLPFRGDTCADRDHQQAREDMKSKDVCWLIHTG